MSESGFKLLVITTSYPLGKDAVSGIFVKRLTDAIADEVPLEIVCPAGKTLAKNERTNVVQCRYAPRRLESLAHAPGGIPVALAVAPWRWILVPGLLFSMFLHSALRAKGKQGILANWSICGVIGGIVGKLWRIPVIATLRGDDVTRALRTGPSRWMLNLCVLLCDHIVLVSDAMYTHMCQCFPHHQGKFKVIHNGVDPQLLHVTPSSFGDSLRLLYLGSLIERKAVDTLISALTKLPDYVTLHIVGEGPQEKKLRMLAHRLQVEPRVRFSGYVLPDDVPELFKDSDILVLPSTSEGRPNVIIEAMAAARVVVASDIDGVRELLEPLPGNSMFPVGSVDDLATAIRKYLGLDTCLLLGQQNREYVIAQGLTWPNTAQRYLWLLNYQCNAGNR